MDPSGLKVAVVHDWIAARAGSEKVFEALARVFPTADLWCLTKDPTVHLEVGGRSLRSTWLDVRFLRERRNVSLPLMPLAWQLVPSMSYDLVISSSLAFAHSVRFGRNTTHLSYVYSPARYVWSPDIDGRGQSNVLRPVRHMLRKYDRHCAQYVSEYAGISTEVASRIERYWGRGSRVIHPPVDMEFYTPATAAHQAGGGYVLGVSRWIPYKRLDLVIAAAQRARLPCVIAGAGPEGRRLRAQADGASIPVQFVESPSDEQLRDLYRAAGVLVFPALEDFGIVPVEANACGTPAVVLERGGTRDTIVPGVNGVRVDTPTPSILAKAIQEALGLDRALVRPVVERFGYERFSNEIKGWVMEALTARGKAGGMRMTPSLGETTTGALS